MSDKAIDEREDMKVKTIEGALMLETDLATQLKQQRSNPQKFTLILANMVTEARVILSFSYFIEILLDRN